MEYKASFRHILIVLLFLFVSLQSALGGTIYVDASATGANNGSSWGNAYIYLQDALTAAISGDNIWVAEGTYKPDHGVGVTIGDRNATFELKAGVSIYGGFPVGGGTLEQRDPNLNETILSGDLNSDDQPNFVNHSENSKIITKIGWTTGTTTLDGFTIEAAYDSLDTNIAYGLYDEGGGQITISNCKFLNNKGYTIRFRNPNDTGYEHFVGTLTGFEITNCLFQNNSGVRVIYMRGCSPVFRNCLFKQNTCYSIYSSSFKAWPNNQVYSNPTLINVTFIGNSSTALYISGECTSLLVNCVLAANSQYGIFAEGMSGGGMTTLVNCSIVENGVEGIDCMNSGTPIDLTNCIIWGNNNNGLQIFNGYTSAVATNSCIQDAVEDGTYVHTGAGPGVITSNCIDWNPQFSIYPDDGGDGWGVGDNDDFGDLHLQHTSPCIDSADNASVPADTEDLDGDGNITEPIPYDLDGHPRIVDGDCNSTIVVDMGAYEFAYLYLGDFAGGCDVDFIDFAVLASAWLTEEGQAGYDSNCDIALPSDGKIDMKDLEVFTENWLLNK
jgi:hypothetical protein